MSKAVLMDSRTTGHHDWIVPRRVMCAFFWVGIILLFTGIILLVTSKHKQGQHKTWYQSWGSVLLGLGFCLMLVCLILCMHAYCVITVSDDEAPALRTQHSSQRLVPPSPHGSLRRSALQEPPNPTKPGLTQRSSRQQLVDCNDGTSSEGHGSKQQLNTIIEEDENEHSPFISTTNSSKDTGAYGAANSGASTSSGVDFPGSPGTPQTPGTPRRFPGVFFGLPEPGVEDYVMGDVDSMSTPSLTSTMTTTVPVCVPSSTLDRFKIAEPGVAETVRYPPPPCSAVVTPITPGEGTLNRAERWEKAESMFPSDRRGSVSSASSPPRERVGVQQQISVDVEDVDRSTLKSLPHKSSRPPVVQAHPPGGGPPGLLRVSPSVAGAEGEAASLSHVTTETPSYNRPIITARVTELPLNRHKDKEEHLIPNGSPPQMHAYQRQYPVGTVHAYPLATRPPPVPPSQTRDSNPHGNHRNPYLSRFSSRYPFRGPYPAGYRPNTPEGAANRHPHPQEGALGAHEHEDERRGSNPMVVYLSPDQDFSESKMSIYDNVHYIRV